MSHVAIEPASNSGDDVVFSGSSPDVLPSESLSVSKKTIKEITLNFLRKCGTPCVATSMPDEFRESCIEDAIKLGYPLEGYHSLQAYFQVGAMMGYTSFAHRELPVRMYIARFTAIHLYLDDQFKKHYDGLLRFNERLLRNEHQEEKIFQCLSKLLLELPQHFDPLACNLMTVSTHNYVASLIIEHDTENMKLSNQALGYPAYSRKLSGIAESFAFFIFKRDFPVQTYLQALPEIMDYLCYTNDVLSFYKEELLGDAANYVTFLAGCRSMTKDLAFQHLAEECAAAYERVVLLLQPNQAAYETWTAFCKRYVSFHASLGRYKLEELELVL